MNIIEMLKKYYKRTLAIKSKGTARFELGNNVSLEKCLTSLNIIETRQLDLSSGYLIIRWYRDNTNNSNNSINKRIAYLKRVLKFNNIKTSFHDVEFLKKDTTPYMKFKDNELRIIF